MLDQYVYVLFCILRLCMLLRLCVAKRGSAFILLHGVLNFTCLLLLSTCAMEALFQHLKHQDMSDKCAFAEDLHGCYCVCREFDMHNTCLSEGRYTLAT